MSKTFGTLFLQKNAWFSINLIVKHSVPKKNQTIFMDVVDSVSQLLQDGECFLQNKNSRFLTLREEDRHEGFVILKFQNS